jgi:hypothetical protein
VSYRQIPRVSSILLVLLLSVAGCNYPGMHTGAPPPGIHTAGVCESMPGLGLDLEVAASALALVGPEDALTLGTLGAQGAQALADHLQPQGTFCDADVPAAFAPILEQARQLADQGDREGARKMLNSLLEMGGLPHGSGLLSVLGQNAQDARSRIRGYLDAGGLDQYLGGDGQDFIDRANATFNQMANSELSSASFDETLRLLDEAQALGQDNIAQRALKRAQDIAAQGLQAAIEDLDPCLANPQDLRDGITKLLLAFQTASLVGVPETHGPGDSRYDATWAGATEALKALGGATPIGCICDHFTLIFNEELHQTTPQLSNNIFIRGPVEVKINLSQDPPTLEGSGSLTVTGSGNIEDCALQDSGSDDVTISGTVSPGEGQAPPMLHLSVVHTMQLQFQACGGGGGMPVPLTLDPSQTDLPFRDGEVTSWPMTQPSVTAVTTYTLDVPCGR